MLSSWLRLNTLWDGIFHSLTYLFVLAGLFVLWRSAQHRHLGLHHVNETVPRGTWIYWNIAFTMFGIAMLAAGRRLTRQG